MKPFFRVLFAVVFSLAFIQLNSIDVQAEGEETQIEQEVEQSFEGESAPSEEKGDWTEVQVADVMDESEKPTIVPGEFLYFFKTFVERIQLALTFDEVEKAKLLTDLAKERILEAKVLLENGNEQLAKETLEKAFEQQELAIEVGKSTEDQAVENEEMEEKVDGMDEKVTKNILVLQQLVEKIKNEKAKEALTANIARMTMKLEEKLAKKQQKYEEKKNEIAKQLKEGKITPDEAEIKLKELEEKYEKKQRATQTAFVKQSGEMIARVEKKV
ncbi:DUF5667 domain-containing protein, partial [Anoxybacillus sp. LAT_35]